MENLSFSYPTIGKKIQHKEYYIMIYSNSALMGIPIIPVYKSHATRIEDPLKDLSITMQDVDVDKLEEAMKAAIDKLERNQEDLA